MVLPSFRRTIFDVIRGHRPPTEDRCARVAMVSQILHRRKPRPVYRSPPWFRIQALALSLESVVQ